MIVAEYMDAAEYVANALVGVRFRVEGSRKIERCDSWRASDSVCPLVKCIVPIRCTSNCGDLAS